MNEITTLWAQHRDAEYPRVDGPSAGELMTLDTVVCGCVTHFLDSEDGLDPQRVEMLQDCMKDLTGLIPELDETAAAYFGRLHTLAQLLLDSHPR